MVKTKKLDKKTFKEKKAPVKKKVATKPVKAKPLKKTTVKAPVKTAKVVKTARVVLRKKEIPRPPTVEPIKKKEIPKPISLEAVKVEQAKPALKKEIPKVTISAQPKPTVIPKVTVVAPAAVKETVPVEKALPTRILEIELPITVKDLSVKLQEKPSILIKQLMDMGLMVGINQSLDEATIARICQKYDYQIRQAPDAEELALRIHSQTDLPSALKPRSPIVTFMGHVDHGKTSLLDAIRKTKVVDSEHGGITQHIGAYKVVLPHGEITFLDTPGHEAFTAMRSRGASITDIVVLVVAADDGVMPQTQEAIDHSRAAGVPIIVAINKIDKPQADLDRVKKQLSALNLMAEDWGGKTITVPVSAKTGKGIDDLLEMILLEAQMLELKANPNRLAKGVVVEAKLQRDKGPVVTLLVQNGMLHLNNHIIVDKFYGKIKAMFNDRGQAVAAAGPASAVEILGLSGVPEAGEQFFIVEDEKIARGIALGRQEKRRQQQIGAVKRISLEDLHTQIKEDKIKELKLILKVDVQGSLAAITETLNKLNVSEIKLDIIHEGVGSINSSDVVLAVASNALILGFNVTADARAKEIIAKEGVDVRTYNIIYELANDIKAAVEGMLEPKLKKVFLGRAEIRKVFKLSRSGTVAGCFVTKGKITRTVAVNVVRNGEVVFEGKLSSLKRFKDDVREVAEGTECGISLEGFTDIKEGDIIDAYNIEKIARKL